MHDDLKAYIEKWRPEVEKTLGRLLPDEAEEPRVLHEAMRYSTLGGGKRVRAVLCAMSCRALGGREEDTLAAGAAIECLHAYSLVHDDLPAMDDDDLRRGRPTCHKKFGEAVAILAGDALLTYAFEIISREYRPDLAAPLALVLARKAGNNGMVGGQVLDVISEGAEIAGDALRERVDGIHAWKTAALISASAEMGAIIARADDAGRKMMSEFGRLAGLAFQAADDLLDETSTPEEMGKAVGKDRERGKLTLPVAYGMDGANEIASRLTHEALGVINPLGDRAHLLAELAKYIVKRKN